MSIGDSDFERRATIDTMADYGREAAAEQALKELSGTASASPSSRHVRVSSIESGATDPLSPSTSRAPLVQQGAGGSRR